jgi:hypothetical protein
MTNALAYLNIVKCIRVLFILNYKYKTRVSRLIVTHKVANLNKVKS